MILILRTVLSGDVLWLLLRPGQDTYFFCMPLYGIFSASCLMGKSVFLKHIFTVLIHSVNSVLKGVPEGLKRRVRLVKKQTKNWWLNLFNGQGILPPDLHFKKSWSQKVEHAFTKKNSIHPKDQVVSGSCENDESEGDSECDEDDDDQVWPLTQFFSVSFLWKIIYLLGGKIGENMTPSKK